MSIFATTLVGPAMNCFRPIDLVVLVFLTLTSGAALSAAGEERFAYDALGRLRQVTFADGRTIQYTYDKAGNRKTVVSGGSGGAPQQPGTIALMAAAYPSGCASCTGTFWIDIKNTGSGALQNVSLSLARIGQAGCTPTSSAVSSMAPGQTVRLTWMKSSSSPVNCGPTVSAGNATNSPAIWSNL